MDNCIKDKDHHQSLRVRRRGNNRLSPSKFVNKNLGGQPQGVLELIRGAEGGYESMFPSETISGLTEMTITEVVALQKEKLKDGRESAAVGAYQMLYPDRYVEAAGLTMSSKFTPENQEELAQAFLAERGLTAEKAAKDPAGFAKGLAQGFAGVPVLEAMQGQVQKSERGRSYYRGVGRNKKATVSPEVVEEAVKKYGESFNVEAKNQMKYQQLRDNHQTLHSHQIKI